MINLGEWSPDAGAIGKGGLRRCEGVIPAKGGYRPFPSFAAATEAAGAIPAGAFSFRDQASGVHNYAGFPTTLQELNSDGSWTDRSRVGGYTATAGARWRAVQFGDRCIASNGVDDMQSIAMSAASDFSDLAGDPPKAKYLAAVGQQLVTANDEVSAYRIAFSGLGDVEEWADADVQAGAEILPDGGQLTGLGAYEDVAFAFQEFGIRRLVYVGGGVVFDMRSKVSVDQGLAAPGSLAQLGRFFFLRSGDGFYIFNEASGLIPIGDEKIDRFFTNDAPRAYWARMSAAVDPTRKLYALAYASAQSNGTPDTVLIYHWGVKRWALARIGVEILSVGVSPGYTLEDLDDLYGDLDSIPFSLDDPALAGGALSLNAMTAAGVLGRFSGPPVEALLELDDVSGGKGVMNHQGALPYIDTSAALYSVGYRLKPADTVAYSGEQANSARGGWAFNRARGRLIRPRFRIPAGTSWTLFEGADFELSLDSET